MLDFPQGIFSLRGGNSSRRRPLLGTSSNFHEQIRSNRDALDQVACGSYDEEFDESCSDVLALDGIGLHYGGK